MLSKLWSAMARTDDIGGALVTYYTVVSRGLGGSGWCCATGWCSGAGGSVRGACRCSIPSAVLFCGVLCPGRLGFRRDARTHGEKRTVGNVARFPPNAAEHLIHAEALERLHGCGSSSRHSGRRLRWEAGFGGRASTRGRGERGESKVG